MPSGPQPSLAGTGPHCTGGRGARLDAAGFGQSCRLPVHHRSATSARSRLRIRPNGR